MSSDNHGELGHILPQRTYFLTFGALLILTVITVAVSRVDFGNFNLIVAMIIASVKAALVLMFFMHAKYENPVLWTYIAVPMIALALMFFGVFIDNPYRYKPAPHAKTAEELAPLLPGAAIETTKGAPAPGSH
jgi:cytochrome c oxidase subunit IV